MEHTNYNNNGNADDDDNNNNYNNSNLMIIAIIIITIIVLTIIVITIIIKIITTTIANWRRKEIAAKENLQNPSSNLTSTASVSCKVQMMTALTLTHWG